MKDDQVYLKHIRDAIVQINSYTAEGEESFFKKKIIQDAVIRNLEIIGEAAKNHSLNTRKRKPNVPVKYCWDA